MPLSDSHRELIAQTRAANRRQRAKPKPVPNQIGDRDSVTGQHRAIYPDGSETVSGRKLYDAHSVKGDTVTGLRVSAGTVGLLGPKGQLSPLAAPEKEGVRGIATQGPLKTNEVGYLKGQVWNYEEPEEPADGKIKYLYSIVSAGITKFYVGGWQKESKLVKEFDTSYGILFASLDNLGGKRWSANFSYVKDGKYYVEFVPSSGTGWTLESPVAANSFGHGFWRADNITVNTSGNTSNGGPGVPPADLVQTLFAHQETDFWYAWNAQTVIDHQTTYDLTGRGFSTYFEYFSPGATEPAYIVGLDGGESTVASGYSLIFLPLDEASTGRCFPYFSNEYTVTGATYQQEPPFGLISSFETTTTTKNINSLLKINRSGTFGVGKNTVSISETDVTYSSLYDVDGVNVNVTTDNTNFGNFYLDVVNSKVYGIKKSQTFFSGSSSDTDKKLEVTAFNSSFQQSQKTYKTFKPSVLGTGFVLQSVSYHS